jgi:hypothetical protein
MAFFKKGWEIALAIDAKFQGVTGVDRRIDKFSGSYKK